MNKIVSNILVVSIQLIVGCLFLCMLFLNNGENNNVVVAYNGNLNRMADSVSTLLQAEKSFNNVVNNEVEEELQVVDAEEEKREEEQKAEESQVQVIEEEPKETYTVSFNASTGYNSFTLSDDDFGIVAGVIACESINYDDALAVASVILNRVDSSSFPNDPLSVVSAPSQFSCYGYYINNPAGYQGKRSSYADSALTLALSGTRNNNFYYFNNDGLGTQIVSGGNYFR